MQEPSTRETLEIQALGRRLDDILRNLHALASDVGAACDLPRLAACCHSLSIQLRRAEMALHDFMIHGHGNVDPLEPDPLDAVQECLDAAQDQVKGVMSEGYEVDVCKGRLSMALALTDRALTTVSDMLDSLPQARRDEDRYGRSWQ